MIPRYDWCWSRVWGQPWQPMRFENWNGVQQILAATDGELPFFLVGNILEDSLLTGIGHDRTLTTSGISLIDYLKFPLADRNDPIVNAAIIPLATFADQRWQDQHRALVQRQLRGYCVIRGTPDLVDEVLQDFEQFVASKYRVIWTNKLPDSDPGDLYLYEFICQPRPDGG